MKYKYLLYKIHFKHFKQFELFYLFVFKNNYSDTLITYNYTTELFNLYSLHYKNT